LKNVVKKSQALAACRVIETESFTEKDLIAWKVPVSIDPESGNIVPKSLLDKVVRVLERQLREKELTRMINSKNDHISKVFQNQTRLRENIKSLEKMSDSELVKRYLKDLNNEEDDIQKTRDVIDILEKEKLTVQSEIKDAKYESVTEARKMREEWEAQEPLNVEEIQSFGEKMSEKRVVKK